jgi:CDP-diacylglycerol--glycerol-3-phosphate 3-phosphatidyltransferase
MCPQIDTLDETLRNNNNLEVYLHLDLNRSTRPGQSSTAQVVLPLLKDHPNRVHVSLFRSPKLRGIMAKLVPPRFNEGWGTWHAKIYGADDEVMISG